MAEIVRGTEKGILFLLRESSYYLPALYGISKIDMMKRSTRCVVANVLECDIVVSEFKLQSLYYIHFRCYTRRKSLNSLFSSAMGYIVPILFLLALNNPRRLICHQTRKPNKRPKLLETDHIEPSLSSHDLAVTRYQIDVRTTSIQ